MLIMQSRISYNGGNILFVGTKKQAQDAIKTEAERCGQFYVNEMVRRYAYQLQDYPEPYYETERNRDHGVWMEHLMFCLRKKLSL